MTEKTKIGSPKQKFWSVTLNESERGYIRSRCLGVVAFSLQEAIRLVEGKYPDCVVVSISYKGAVDLIVGPEK